MKETYGAAEPQHSSEMSLRAYLFEKYTKSRGFILRGHIVPLFFKNNLSGFQVSPFYTSKLYEE